MVGKPAIRVPRKIFLILGCLIVLGCIAFVVTLRRSRDWVDLAACKPSGVAPVRAALDSAGIPTSGYHQMGGDFVTVHSADKVAARQIIRKLKVSHHEYFARF